MPQEKHVNQSIEIIIADRICDDTRVSAVEFGGVGSSGTPVTIYFAHDMARKFCSLHTTIHARARIMKYGS